MPKRGLILALGVLPFLAGPVLADDARFQALAGLAAKQNPTKTERHAFTFRQIQTDLMVAALQCQGADFRGLYNGFVVKYRPALQKNGRTLKSFFSRTYGAGWQRELDGYVTRLANESSLRSQGEPRFCATALEQFEVLHSVEVVDAAMEALEQAGLQASR